MRLTATMRTRDVCVCCVYAWPASTVFFLLLFFVHGDNKIVCVFFLRSVYMNYALSGNGSGNVCFWIAHVDSFMR